MGAVMTGSSGHFKTAAVVASANIRSSTRISCVEWRNDALFGQSQPNAISQAETKQTVIEMASTYMHAANYAFKVRTRLVRHNVGSGPFYF